MNIKILFLFIISLLFVSCAKQDEAGLNPDLPVMESSRGAFRSVANLGVDNEVEARVAGYYNDYWTLFQSDGGFFYGYTYGMDRNQFAVNSTVVVSGTWYNSWIMGYPQVVTVAQKKLEYSGTVAIVTSSYLYLRNSRVPNKSGTSDPYTGSYYVYARICSSSRQAVNADCPSVPEEARVVGARVTVTGVPYTNSRGTTYPYSIYNSVTVTMDTSTPFHNRSAPADVNGDGKISSLDLLTMSNALGRYLPDGTTSLDLLTQRSYSGILQIDANGDNRFSPVDILVVQNEINRRYNHPTPFHNSSNPGDVNGDGNVTPLDLLTVINASKRFLGQGVTSVDLDAFRGDPYLAMIDLSGDNRFSALDLLQMTNAFRNNR